MPLSPFERMMDRALDAEKRVSDLESEVAHLKAELEEVQADSVRVAQDALRADQSSALLRTEVIRLQEERDRLQHEIEDLRATNQSQAACLGWLAVKRTQLHNRLTGEGMRRQLRACLWEHQTEEALIDGIMAFLGDVVKEGEPQ